MGDSLETLFRTDYMPHGHCYWWNPEILWLNVVSDVLIAFAYFSIPIILHCFVKRRPDIEFKGLFILFSLFIALCGLTHLVSIVVIWHATYGIHGLIKLVTAIISCITAYKLFKSMPIALQIPSPNQLREMNEEANKEKLARINLENQKQRDLLLRESTDNAHVGVLVLDEKGRIKVANQSVCSIFEYSQEELEGHNIDMLIDKETREYHSNLVAGFIAGSTENKRMAAGRLVTGLTKSGRLVPIEIALRQRRLSGENVVYASILDISERLSTQKALQKSEKTTSSIIESLPIGLHEFKLIDDELILTGYNPAADRTLGMDHSPHVGKRLEEVFTGDIEDENVKQQDVIAQYKQVAAHGGARVNDIRTYGEGANKQIYLVHSFQSNPDTVIVLFQDITEQKQAEQELREKEQFIRRAFDSSITGVYIFNHQLGRHEFINQSYTRISGYSMQQLEEIGAEFFDMAFHPDDKQAVIEHSKRLMKCMDDEALRIEYRFKHADGHWIWCVSLDTVFKRDSNGRIISSIGSFLDISDSKNMQNNLEYLKDKAEKANAIKSEFLANMSHEIRTPMNAILGLTHIVLDMELGNKQRQYLKKIYNSSKSLLNILNDILDYSKIEAGKIDILDEPFDIENLLENVFGLFSQIVEDKEVVLLVDMPVDLPRLYIGDALRISQILNNIIGNAIKFTEQGYVKVIVSEQNIDDSERQLVIFDVEDSGIGMDEELVGHLFTSFTQGDSSISRNYGGTGLGLSISMGLANSMQGNIRVSSQLGQGSKFSLELPLKKGSNNGALPELPKPMRTLVIDECVSSLKVMVNMLEAWHFDVTSCENSLTSRQLIESAIKSKSPFELIIFDWKMPTLDDLKLSDLLHGGFYDQQLDAKVMMTTAYGRNYPEHEINSQGIDYIIEKPVLPSKLQNALIELQSDTAFSGDKQSYSGVTKANDHKIDLHGVNILLVEDNETNQLVASEILTSLGAKITIAKNGQQCVDMFTNNDYQVILMDLQMPVMDGYRATQLIRESEKGKSIPIIAMSAAVMNSDVEKVHQAGMNDHIAKPIEMSRLTSVLAKWLEINHSQSNLEEPVKEGQRLNTHASWIDLLQQNGFDTESALKKLAGNISIYKKLLTSFIGTSQQYLAELNDCDPEQDAEKCQRIIHTLKGLSGSIGASKLSEQSITLDRLLKSGATADLGSYLQELARVSKVLQQTDELHTEQELEDLSSFNQADYSLSALQEYLQNGRFVSDLETRRFYSSLSTHLSEKELKLLFSALEELRYADALAILRQLQ